MSLIKTNNQLRTAQKHGLYHDVIMWRVETDLPFTGLDRHGIDGNYVL